MLTRDSLDNLLLSLDEDRERAGEKYETLRRGLVRFFEWRGCVLAEQHADEAIDRTARKVTEGEQIRNIQSYLVGVARFVYLEVVKEQEKINAVLRQVQQTSPVEQPDDVRMDCIRECLEQLPADSYQLVMDYYQEQARDKINLRKQLAAKSGISAHTLRMRLHRIRLKLEECVSNRLQRSAAGINIK